MSSAAENESNKNIFKVVAITAVAAVSIIGLAWYVSVKDQQKKKAKKQLGGEGSVSEYENQKDKLVAALRNANTSREIEEAANALTVFAQQSIRHNLCLSTSTARDLICAKLSQENNEEAAAALANLACICTAVLEAQKMFATPTVRDTVLNTLARFEGCALVCKWICRTVLNIANNSPSDPQVRIFLTANYRDAVVNALRKCDARGTLTSDTAQWIIGSFGSVAPVHVDTQNIFGTPEVRDAIYDTIENHAHSSESIFFILSCVTLMTEEKNRRPLWCTAQAARVLLKCFDRATTPDAAQWVFGLLMNLPGTSTDMKEKTTVEGKRKFLYDVDPSDPTKLLETTEIGHQLRDAAAKSLREYCLHGLSIQFAAMALSTLNMRYDEMDREAEGSDDEDESDMEDENQDSYGDESKMSEKKLAEWKKLSDEEKKKKKEENQWKKVVFRTVKDANILYGSKQISDALVAAMRRDASDHTKDSICWTCLAIINITGLHRRSGQVAFGNPELRAALTSWFSKFPPSKMDKDNGHWLCSAANQIMRKNLVSKKAFVDEKFFDAVFDMFERNPEDFDYALWTISEVCQEHREGQEFLINNTRLMNRFSKCLKTLIQQGITKKNAKSPLTAADVIFDAITPLTKLVLDHKRQKRQTCYIGGDDGEGNINNKKELSQEDIDTNIAVAKRFTETLIFGSPSTEASTSAEATAKKGDFLSNFIIKSMHTIDNDEGVEIFCKLMQSFFTNSENIKNFVIVENAELKKQLADALKYMKPFAIGNFDGKKVTGAYEGKDVSKKLIEDILALVS